jgi:hypothetical protein
MPHHQPAPNPHSRLPKFDFPKFDGENPRLWHTRCENYFSMYLVEPSTCVRVVSVQMVDAAALWLQSIESQLESVSWEQFCVMVRDRFDQDQHELLVRQLLQICHTSSVLEYIARFTSLTDQLIAYNKGVDPIYFVTRFIDGLKPELRVVLLVQRHQTLDTSCTLALLQEEVGTSQEAMWTPSFFIARSPRQHCPCHLHLKLTS